jgi:hypothetical protein
VANERGEIVTLLFIVITLIVIAGSVALSYGVKCDPAVQRCVDEKK